MRPLQCIRFWSEDRERSLLSTEQNLNTCWYTISCKGELKTLKKAIFALLKKADLDIFVEGVQSEVSFTLSVKFVLKDH